LGFGVTSRAPGEGGGEAGCVCAVWAGDLVEASLMLELFRP